MPTLASTSSGTPPSTNSSCSTSLTPTRDLDRAGRGRTRRRAAARTRRRRAARAGRRGAPSCPSRAATSRSSRSPWPCPSASLTSLKRSRSSISRAKLRLHRRGALDLMLEPAQQLAAVGDAGEIVVERLVVARLGVPAQLARGARDDREEDEVEQREARRSGPGRAGASPCRSAPRSARRACRPRRRRSGPSVAEQPQRDVDLVDPAIAAGCVVRPPRRRPACAPRAPAAPPR